MNKAMRKKLICSSKNLCQNLNYDEITNYLRFFSKIVNMIHIDYVMLNCKIITIRRKIFKKLSNYLAELN